MSTSELALEFTGNSTVEVAFDRTDSGTLAFTNPVTAKDRADLRWYIETYGAVSLADPDDQEAKRIEARLPEIGKALFKAVFDDRKAQRLFDSFQDAHAQARVLTINAQDAAILALPWELLHDPTGVFLFRERPQISIRRKIAGATGGRQAFRLKRKKRLHLLFVVSRPCDAGFIDPRADAQAVLDAIEQAAPGRVSWEFLRPATLNALVARLDDTSKPAIDILHFDGHGLFRQLSEKDVAEAPGLYGKAIESELQREQQARKESTPGQPVGIGFLLFENEAGTQHLVSAADLSENLFRAQVGLVVLSACQTAMLDDDGSDPMASVAGKLTSTGIPAILAMTHAVLVATTRLLFGQFYASLGRGRGLASALDDARAYLDNNPQKYEVQRGEQRQMLTLVDWFLPVLYHGGSDVPLLTRLPPPNLPQPGGGTVATSTSSQLPPQVGEGWEGVKGGVSNLRPAHEAGFFGRQRELWNIERWFAGGETRRISLTGFGGQGKTELALEAGRWLLRVGLFDAAVFVDYAQVQSADALAVAVSTIGAVLKVSLTDANAVTAALSQMPTLLIFDNLENVAADALAELLSAGVAWSTAGHSRLMLTSRTPDFNHPNYRIEGTRKHRRIALRGLGSAAYPDDALNWFGELSKLPSAAPAQVPPPKRGELIDLFDRVQFHPLSIAVLAQQLKNRSAKQINQRLAELLQTEVPPGALAEGTPRSLLASLQISLERLSASERHAVRRLGVFQGGAMEDNLLVITELGETAWPALRRQMEAAALIQAEALPEVTPPFLRFHPTLALLLWAQLDEDEQTQLTTAHRQRYYAVANYLDSEDTKHPLPARAIAHRELPNLLHAVQQALAAGDPDAVWFVIVVNRFLNHFGMTRAAAALTARAEKIGGTKGSPAWYLAQSDRGTQLLDTRQIAAATQCFAEIRQTLGDQPSYELAVTLGRLGRCYEADGRPDQAEVLYGEAIAVTQQLAEDEQAKRERGILHTDLADALAAQRKFPEARAQYEYGLQIARDGNDDRQEGVVLYQLGTLALREGNPTEAMPRYAEAHQLFQRLGEPASEASVHHQLGLAFQATKQWEQAEQHYREAATLQEKLGNLARAAGTWNQLALVSKATDKLSAAECWYRKAIKVNRKNPSGELAVNLSNLADLLLSQPERLAEARQLAEEALTIKKTLDPNAAEIWKTYTLLDRIADQARQPAQAATWRAAKRNLPGTAHEMKRFAEVILGTCQAVQEPAKAAAFSHVLSNWEENGGAKLVGTISRILSGERDKDALCYALDYQDSMIVETILQALADPSMLHALLTQKDTQ